MRICHTRLRHGRASNLGCAERHDSPATQPQTGSHYGHSERLGSVRFSGVSSAAVDYEQRIRHRPKAKAIPPGTFRARTWEQPTPAFLSGRSTQGMAADDSTRSSTARPTAPETRARRRPTFACLTIGSRFSEAFRPEGERCASRSRCRPAIANVKRRLVGPAKAGPRRPLEKECGIDHRSTASRPQRGGGVGSRAGGRLLRTAFSPGLPLEALWQGE